MNNERKGEAPTAELQCEGIYVASRVKHAEMWKSYRAGGTPIIASWIDEAGEGETADFGELWQRIREEIGRSKALIFYGERGDDPWKGALVEVGVALALGKPVYVVLKGIVPEGRTLRPIGSWLLDRNVKVWEELDDALIKATLLPPTPVQDLQHRLFRKIVECATLEAELRTLRKADAHDEGTHEGLAEIAQSPVVAGAEIVTCSQCSATAHHNSHCGARFCPFPKAGVAVVVEHGAPIRQCAGGSPCSNQPTGQCWGRCVKETIRRG